MKLKDSETFKNLARAYAGECQAKTRYEFVEYGFRNSGYEAIATIIDKIVYQEFNHARMLYTFIQDAEVKQVKNIEIDAGYPFKEKWELEENLRLLAEDEVGEAESYEEFIGVAKEEGFNEIASLFEKIRDVELRHREVFLELYNQFAKGEIYNKKVEVWWYCPACGYMEKGKKAWDTCPLCGAKQGVCQIVFPDGYII